MRFYDPHVKVILCGWFTSKRRIFTRKKKHKKHITFQIKILFGVKTNSCILLKTDLGVQLIGGSSSKEGNVFARNSATGLYGPVCDDEWTIENVSFFQKN